MKAFKKGYTLAEGLVSMLIISAIGVSAMYIANGYFKQTYVRDLQTTQVIENINIIEKLKSEVHTLPQLYTFAGEHDIRIVAVGVGEVTLAQKPNGDIEIYKISDEGFGFSEVLKPDNLYRIEVSETQPNTKLTAIIRLEDS